MFRHHEHKNFWCDINGRIYSDKFYNPAYGKQHTLNKILKENGYWKPSIHNLKDGYCGVNISNKMYRRARFVMECYTGKEIPKDYVVDHINRNRKDDRICNLRIVTQKENIDEPRRNKIVAEKLRLSLDEYLKTPKTRSHFKRDIEKRGMLFEMFDENIFDETSKPKKYIYKIKMEEL